MQGVLLTLIGRWGLVVFSDLFMPVKVFVLGVLGSSFWLVPLSQIGH